MGGNIDIVKLLLKEEVSIRHSTKGVTPFMRAVEGNHYDLVEYFLNQLEIDLEFYTNKGTTPVMMAVANGKEDILNLLLQKGAKLTHNSKS